MQTCKLNDFSARTVLAFVNLHVVSDLSSMLMFSDTPAVVVPVIPKIGAGEMLQGTHESLSEVSIQGLVVVFVVP